MSDMLSEQPATAVGRGTVGEVARLALKLGFTAFGGPAAHIAMLRNDLVTRLGWLSDQQLLDAVAIGQVTPGPVFTTASGYSPGHAPTSASECTSSNKEVHR